MFGLFLKGLLRGFKLLSRNPQGAYGFRVKGRGFGVWGLEWHLLRGLKQLVNYSFLLVVLVVFEAFFQCRYRR